MFWKRHLCGWPAAQLRGTSMCHSEFILHFNFPVLTKEYGIVIKLSLLVLRLYTKTFLFLLISNYFNLVKLFLWKICFVYAKNNNRALHSLFHRVFLFSTSPPAEISVLVTFLDKWFGCCLTNISLRCHLSFYTITFL